MIWSARTHTVKSSERARHRRSANHGAGVRAGKARVRNAPNSTPGGKRAAENPPSKPMLMIPGPLDDHFAYRREQERRRRSNGRLQEGCRSGSSIRRPQWTVRALSATRSAIHGRRAPTRRPLPLDGNVTTDRHTGISLHRGRSDLERAEEDALGATSSGSRRRVARRR